MCLGESVTYVLEHSVRAGGKVLPASCRKIKLNNNTIRDSEGAKVRLRAGKSLPTKTFADEIRTNGLEGQIQVLGLAGREREVDDTVAPTLEILEWNLIMLIHRKKRCGTSGHIGEQGDAVSIGFGDVRVW